MAIATGIPASVWADEGERTVVTAIDLLVRRNRGGGEGGPQMGG